MEDLEMVYRLARGDSAAFGLLYDLHWKSVYTYAWWLTKSVAESEDIAQDCFLALARRARSFNPSRCQLRTWLLAVARRQAWQRLRKRRMSESAEDDGLGWPTPGPDPEAALIGQERSESVRRALELLPAAQREALYLFEFEELTVAEVAGILGIEPNAVKGRLFRGRERLGELLRPLAPCRKALDEE
jgi:RNA polymerase sigma-70 factor, ECF subfamily